MEQLVLKFSCVSPEEKEILNNFPIHDESDIFFYDAEISTQNGEDFISFVNSNRKKNKLVLYLSTNGGDADAAYRMARYIQNTYESFVLCVFGFCKSAGTLLALGSQELVLGDRGELGPLDVQVHDPDEFLQRSSGLSIYQALELLGDKAFELFEDIFLKVRRRSGGVITTQTASDIATGISVGLYSPITAQIDCARVGELQRSLDIVIEYGRRLGADMRIVKHLAQNFPSHSFVIDKKECLHYFDNIREPTPAEALICENLRGFSLEKYNSDFTRYPLKDDIMGYLLMEGEEVENDNSEKSNNENTGKKTQPSNNSKRNRRKSNLSSADGTKNTKND